MKKTQLLILLYDSASFSSFFTLGFPMGCIFPVLDWFDLSMFSLFVGWLVGWLVAG
jgi:hypothetical protein